MQRPALAERDEQQVIAVDSTVRMAKAAVQADWETGAPLSRRAPPVHWWVGLSGILRTYC